VVRGIGSWTYASIRAEGWFLLWLAAVYLLVLGLPRLYRTWRDGAVCAACAGLLLALCVGAGAWTAAQTDLTVTALNVGQGASTAFLSGNQAALVDCGGNESRSAGDIAADYFATVGRGRLDLLVLTYDDDHVNGLEQLFARMEVTTLWGPDSPSDAMDRVLALAEAAGTQVLLLDEAQETLSFGQGTLTLYPPLGSGTSNESGLFVRCAVGSFDALVTGDADAYVERMLVKYDALPDIELYLVGHHGSKYSTGQDLLAALAPELAVISVGYNSYGHPAQETLDRLAAAGTTVYRTDRDGEVTVALRDGQVTIH
jgi:competence protein ComEC